MRKLLFVITTLIVTSAAAAHADTRRFGGCFGQSDVCAGPSFSVAMTSYNLATHQVEIGALPVGAAGYEVTAFSSQWYRAGASLNLAAAVSNQSANWLAAAVIVSFAEYLRLGAMVRTVGDSAQWSLLAGVGLGGG